MTYLIYCMLSNYIFLDMSFSSLHDPVMDSVWLVQLSVYDIIKTSDARVETRGSENEEEIAFYRNHFISRRPQHHASIYTRGKNGPLWRHNS